MSIALAPLRAADAPILHAWINDRAEVLYNAPYKPVSEAMHLAWFQQVQQRADTVIFGLRLTASDELVGTCQLHHIHWVHRTAELQIRLGSEAVRGKGLGTKATRDLLRFAFHDLNLNRVHLHVFSTNERAIKLYERVGFRREGLLRQAAHLDGRYVDVIVMGLLRDEFDG